MSSVSYATPAVGDHAVFKVKIEQAEGVIGGRYEALLTEKDAGGNFRMKTIITIDGQQPQAREEVVGADSLITDAQIQSALSNCAGYGGVNGAYTEQGLNLPTCVIPLQNDDGSDGGAVHVASVPFGVAKQVEINMDRTVTLEIETYEFGK